METVINHALQLTRPIPFNILDIPRRLWYCRGGYTILYIQQTPPPSTRQLNANGRPHFPHFPPRNDTERSWCTFQNSLRFTHSTSARVYVYTHTHTYTYTYIYIVSIYIYIFIYRSHHLWFLNFFRLSMSSILQQFAFVSHKILGLPRKTQKVNY